MTVGNFIPKSIIIYLHSRLIKMYGGKQGIRDEKLLDSALEQPKATYESEYLHKTLTEMAAAYGYHLCLNHPFVDGNKRIALVAMDIFLQRNGFEITASEKETYEIISALSNGTLAKEDLTAWLNSNIASIM